MGMAIVTTSAPVRPVLARPAGPSAPAPRARAWSGPLAWLRSRRAAWWYAGFASYAAGVAVFSGPGDDRSWGIWASFGYAAAAALAAAWSSRRGQAAAMGAALAGALAAPLSWLALTAPATPDVAVVTRSGALLASHATPYLPAAELAHGGWLAYDPYLPVMALFGLPRAAGLPGLAGDPRPWLAAATLAILAVAFHVTTPPGWPAGRRRAVAARAAVFAVASPVMAFPGAEPAARSPARHARPGRPPRGPGPADRRGPCPRRLPADPAPGRGGRRREAPGARPRLMFALSPDTRFGYFAYPAGLCGWLALSRPGFAATLTGIRDCAGVMPPGAGLRPGKVMARRRVDLGAQ
jgi:hypothetical protein